MRIKKIKINNFGKLKNQEIEFKNGINVIYGENESGKTTLLKFITGMFYGMSKNKNKQKMSDYDKYMPWKGEEFSGSITYILDNNQEYQVYRDFTKKNPQIFDKSGNDVSKMYTVDKTYGNQYFLEQTKVDQELFNMSQVIMQQEVKLDEKKQNTLIQKASNIMSTGEDDVSYQKVLAKLNKIQTEEIGTLKSPTKPLYILEKKIDELNNRKKELEEMESFENEIEDAKDEITNKLDDAKKELEIFQELQKLQNDEKLEEEKINVNKSAKNEIELQKENIEENINQIELEKKVKIPIITYIISVLLTIIGIMMYLINKKTIGISLLVIACAITLISLIINIIKNKNIKQNNEQKNKQLERLKTKLELLENEIKDKEKLIIEREEDIKAKIDLQKSNLKSRYSKIQNSDNLLIKKLENDNVIQKQNFINELKLELTKLEMKQREITNKLGDSAKIQEELKASQEEYEDLLNYNESIEIAKEALESAYIEMRENVTPKFTVDLSNAIDKITNGKYKKVKVNQENELMIETEDGKYVKADVLSTGTIDELYLSLRISSINELIEENMPIILDETFAYFDRKRLENVLEFLSDNYQNRQIIILTCTNRECEALESQDISYNKILLSVDNT